MSSSDDSIGPDSTRTKSVSYGPSVPTIQQVEEVDEHFEMTYENTDSSSTYAALSYFVDQWKQAGGRNVTFIPRKVIVNLCEKFEEENIDISDYDSIPYDAHDIHECLVLLARIQNKMGVHGGTDRAFTMKDLVEDTLLDRSNKFHRYDIGEYVEVLGPSMEWRLEQIQNILKRTSDEGEVTYIYETGVDHELTENKIRWPKEALMYIFGFSPWVWQQWACLRLEHKLSFQKGAATDFEFFDITGFMNDLWYVWLKDDRNKPFRELYDRVGESGQKELLHHIMAPFDLINDVISNEEEWDFEDAQVSIFTYVSLLGSGFLYAFLVFVLQLGMPICLFFYYNSNEADNPQVATREILLLVLLYYFFKVSKDLWTNFERVSGVSEDVYSRVQSLRRIVWENGTDSLAQSLGYTSDQFMNTGYQAILYLFNVWILYTIEEAFEILGSVIFFEFLFDLDEEFASSEWWDPGSRFLKAGVVGCVMQSTLKQEHTFTRDAYFDTYGGYMSADDLEELKGKFDVARIPSGTEFLGVNEADEVISLVTMEERVSVMRKMDSKYSTLFNNETKPRVYFSGFFGSDSAIFERHAKMRAWSQWEKILFLLPTPSVIPDEYEPGAKILCDESLYSSLFEKSKSKASADNRSSIFTLGEDEEYEGVGGVPRNRRFRELVWSVLTFDEFRSYSYDDGSNLTWKNLAFAVTRLIYAILSWISHVVQIFFYPVILFAIVVVYIDSIYCIIHTNGSNRNCEPKSIF